MEGNTRLNRKQNKSRTGFMEILCMLLIVQKTGATPCPAVCLTWKTQNSSLVLICKVDALNFAITFFGPLQNETGFCLPYESCHSLMEKAVIVKTKISDTTNEIIFKIPLNKQLNGLWTCQYGDKNHKSVTEVTLKDVHANEIRKNSYSFECWTDMMIWCVFGFACTYMIVRFAVFVLTSCKNDLEKTISSKSESIAGFITCKCCSVTVGKYVIAFILGSTLFLLPVVVGLVKGEQCKASRFFSCYGAILGIICCLLMINKDQTSTKDKKEHKAKIDNKKGNTESYRMECLGNYRGVDSNDPEAE